MWLDVDFRTLNIQFELGDIWVKSIDASHGIFMHSFPNHMHSFYELHYIIGGKGTLVMNNIEYPLEKNHLFLIGPKQHHAQITNSEHFMEEFHFSFEISQAREQQENSMCKLFKEIDFWIGKDVHGIDKLFEALEDEVATREIGYVLSIQTLLSQILIALARNQSNIIPENRLPTNTPDEKRMSLLDEAFLYSYKNITIKSIAKLLNLSTRQVQRLIKEKYGISFLEMRTQSRLNAAANMLVSYQNNSIQKIAENVGFTDCVYFSSKFKEHFGIRPSEYRKSSFNAYKNI
jgi:AraC-like DNA-binding protein